VKRSNERSEIIAPGETWGKEIKDASTPKGLNVKRSNERSEIIAPGETLIVIHKSFGYWVHSQKYNGYSK
jgi:hypothetical protein